MNNNQPSHTSKKVVPELIKELKSSRNKLIKAFVLPVAFDFLGRVASAAIGLPWGIICGTIINLVARINSAKDLYKGGTELYSQLKRMNKTDEQLKKWRRSLFKATVAYILPLIGDVVWNSLSATIGGVKGILITQGLDIGVHALSFASLYREVHSVNVEIKELKQKLVAPSGHKHKTFNPPGRVRVALSKLQKIQKPSISKLRKGLSSRDTNKDPSQGPKSNIKPDHLLP